MVYTKAAFILYSSKKKKKLQKNWSQPGIYKGPASNLSTRRIGFILDYKNWLVHTRPGFKLVLQGIFQSGFKLLPKELVLRLSAKYPDFKLIYKKGLASFWIQKTGFKLVNKRPGFKQVLKGPASFLLQLGI